MRCWVAHNVGGGTLRVFGGVTVGVGDDDDVAVE